MGAKALAARGRLGQTSRRYADQPDRILDARRDLAVAKIEDYVAKVVADAPPLTADQRDQLALLLRGGGSDAT